jgi:hypothetical protein
MLGSRRAWYRVRDKPPPTRLRPRVTWADIGLNPLAWRLLAIHATFLAISIGLFLRLGLSISWSPTATAGYICLALMLGLWLHFYFVPGTSRDRRAAEVVFVALLLVVFTGIASPAQYAAVALGFPYADRSLASADAWLGIHVPSLAAWTRAHSVFSRLMTVSYFSLMPQIILALLGLGALRARERLWEFAFHFHACLAIALAALVIWPAVCPPAHYGFVPTIGMTHVIGQIKGFHDGSMTVVKLDELEGLVTFPSFHVAGGLMVTWAFRSHRWIQIPLVVLNIAMISATCLTGVHYVIDVLGAAPLFAISLGAYRWWGQGLLSRHAAVP